MRVALYARVSTLDKGQDPDMQLRELREYCQRRGWTVCKEYVDRGVSGSKESRPELNRMMTGAAKREFDAVVVWRFDRFARSTSHLLRALGEFDSLGIAFVSLTEAIDTSTPMGRMVFTILGAVGELERNLIIERVRAGMKNAKAKGVKVGRPRTAVDASQIASLRNAGWSWSEVCAETGLSAGTAKRAAYNLSKRVAESGPASL
jgi:DNA invertase Pin-like site-specific DNA recombinase